MANLSKFFIRLVVLFLAIFFISGTIIGEYARSDTMKRKKKYPEITLPKPETRGRYAIESALSTRRSVRDYSEAPLDLTQISQLLWAAQGVTHPHGYRTAPSAGALYPLEIYLAAGNIHTLDAGIYRYIAAEHKLIQIIEGDQRESLCIAALRQSPVQNAPAVIIISAVYDRVTVKYEERGIRYVHMEAGHAAQNILLQSTALDLGSLVIGAFRDRDVSDVLGLQKAEAPLYIIPVGKLRANMP